MADNNKGISLEEIKNEKIDLVCYLFFFIDFIFIYNYVLWWILSCAYIFVCVLKYMLPFICLVWFGLLFLQLFSHAKFDDFFFPFLHNYDLNQYILVFIYFFFLLFPCKFLVLHLFSYSFLFFSWQQGGIFRFFFFF